MVMLSGGTTQTQPLDGGGLLQSILNAAGGVTNTIANLTTPQQQQQASQIAAAIVQQPQRQPIVVAPNQPMPQTQASPVLLAQNQTAEDGAAYNNLIEQQSDVPKMTPWQQIQQQGYRKPDEPQYAPPPPSPDPQGQPGQPAVLTQDPLQQPPQQQQMPPNLWAGMPQEPLTATLAEERRRRAEIYDAQRRGVISGMPPLPMTPPPSMVGHGAPANWRESFGNKLAQLRGNMDPRGVGAQQQARYQLEMRAWQEHQERLRQHQQAEYNARMGLMRDMASDSRAWGGYESNMAGQGFKAAQQNPAEDWTKPAAIKAAKDLIDGIPVEDKMARMAEIADVWKRSGGAVDLSYMLDRKTYKSQGAEDRHQGAEQRQKNQQQQYDIRDENRDATKRTKEANAKIAETVAGQAKQQQEATTQYKQAQAGIAAINQKIAGATADATIKQKLGAEKQQLQGQAFKALEGQNRNYNQQINTWKGMQSMKQFANPDQQAVIDGQVNAMFGAPTNMADKASRDRMAETINNVLGDVYSDAELKAMRPQIAAMAQALPEKVFEAELFKGYAYGRRQNHILSGKGKAEPAPEAVPQVTPQQSVPPMSSLKAMAPQYAPQAGGPPLQGGVNQSGSFANIFKGGPAQGRQQVTPPMPPVAPPLPAQSAMPQPITAPPIPPQQQQAYAEQVRQMLNSLPTSGAAPSWGPPEGPSMRSAPPLQGMAQVAPPPPPQQQYMLPGAGNIPPDFNPLAQQQQQYMLPGAGNIPPGFNPLQPPPNMLPGAGNIPPGFNPLAPEPNMLPGAGTIPAGFNPLAQQDMLPGAGTIPPDFNPLAQGAPQEPPGPQWRDYLFPREQEKKRKKKSAR